MDQINFQSYDEVEGFNPVQRTDTTGALDRRNAQLRRDEEAFLSGLRRNTSTHVQNAKQQGQDLITLSKFSKTLTDFLVKEEEKQNERDMEEGMMLAYTEGADLTAVDEAEEQLLDVERQVNAAADEFESQGGDAFTGNRIRNLSGWKQVGFQKGRAQMGAIEYPMFYAAAKETAKLEINGRVIGYSTVGLAPDERAALDAHVRSQFLKQFSGMNPAFLNKYLFPAMRRFETQEATKYVAEEEARIKNNRKELAKDNFYNGLEVSPGQTFLDLADNVEGNFANKAEARKEAVTLLEAFLKDDSIPIEKRIQAYNDLVGHEFDHRGMGRTTIGKAFGRDFGRLEQVLFEVQQEGARRSRADRDVQTEEFRGAWEEAVRSKSEKGEAFTNEEIAAIKEDARKELGYVPSFLENYETAQDRDDESDRERLLEIRRSRGYLLESDLEGVSAATYAGFIDQVRSDKPMAEMPAELTKEADERIIAATNDFFDVTIADKAKTGDWVDFKQRAQRAYRRKVQENILKGDDQQTAHDNALKSVLENAKKDVGTYTKPDTATPNQQNRENLKRAQEFLLQNGPNSYTTDVLPGGEGALAQAQKYADTGVGSMPLLYQQLAERYKGVTAWDIADAQLKASGHPGMLRPPVEQVTDQMSPEAQKLLRWKPSPARTNRAMQEPQVGNKGFLRLIKSKESMAYGEYDAYNLSGSNGGRTAHGSGNSNDGRYGKPLSQLTLAQVMELGSSGKIWAAGAYQFVPGTLREIVQYAGISPDTVFDAETQDFLAMARARQRMSFDPGIGGLRREWVGLEKVDDATLMKYYTELQNGGEQSSAPYYDRPENMIPQLAYITGNIGPTSTGPHLDVKEVGGGNFAEDALDEFVEVDDPEFGRVSLGEIRKRTGGKGDNQAQHRARGSHGIDYGLYSGTKVYVKNGAKVIGTRPSAHGDVVTIQLPNGKKYTFLHGKGVK